MVVGLCRIDEELDRPHQTASSHALAHRVQRPQYVAGNVIVEQLAELVVGDLRAPFADNRSLGLVEVEDGGSRCGYDALLS